MVFKIRRVPSDPNVEGHPYGNAVYIQHRDGYRTAYAHLDSIAEGIRPQTFVKGGQLLGQGDMLYMAGGAKITRCHGPFVSDGEVEEIVDPDTGEVLDSDMTTAGKMEVTSVKEKICYCKAVDGGDAIKKGMTVFPGE